LAGIRADAIRPLPIWKGLPCSNRREKRCEGRPYSESVWFGAPCLSPEQWDESGERSDGA